MNIFRFIGDAGRDLSILLMLYRLYKRQNGVDVSIKTQEFFFIVYLTRYLDIFVTYYSFYNSSMKILYITASLYIVHILHVPSGNLRYTLVDANQDISRRSFVLVPPAIVALLTTNNIFYPTYHVSVLGYLWTFSISLEAWAMIPQLLIIHRKQCAVDSGISFYCLFQFSHRFFYILNWVYRSYTEPYYQHNFLVYIFGCIHCVLISLPWVWKHYDIDPFHLATTSNTASSEGDEERGPLIYHLLVDRDT